MIVGTKIKSVVIYGMLVLSILFCGCSFYGVFSHKQAITNIGFGGSLFVIIFTLFGPYGLVWRKK